MQCSRRDVAAALGDRHNFRVFDHGQLIAPQFKDIDVVIDHGGLVGTREMADVSSGQVKLWQVLGSGIDHFYLSYWRAKKIPVSSSPGTASADALADMAMMFILTLARRLPTAPGALREQLYNEPMGGT